MDRLKDMVAIVTGAGSGIGQAIALAFAAEGARLVVAGRRLAKVQETADRIAEAGGEALAVAADVAQAADVARLVAQCTDRFGAVDILVNNAGIYLAGGILKTGEEEWDQVLSTNLKGVLLCSKAVVPLMLAKGRGRIINIASSGGVAPSLNAVYCASKAAVLSLTRSMALELSPGGITVNAICPGTTFSDMNRERLRDGQVRAQEEARTLVGRLGDPGDIAAGAVYLATADAAFVTGAALVIDGGSTINFVYGR